MLDRRVQQRHELIGGSRHRRWNRLEPRVSARAASQRSDRPPLAEDPLSPPTEGVLDPAAAGTPRAPLGSLARK